MHVDKTLNGVKRVRLSGNEMRRHTPETIAKIRASVNDRITSGVLFKDVREGYEKTGLKPRLMTGQPKTGEPLFKKQSRKRRRFIRLIKGGYRINEAARIVGWSPKRVEFWLERGAMEQKFYKGFYRETMRAETFYEHKLLANLRKHQQKDWKPVAFELERRFHKNWGKRSMVENKNTFEGEITLKQRREFEGNVHGDDSLRAHARDLIEGEDFEVMAPR